MRTLQQRKRTMEIVLLTLILVLNLSLRIYYLYRTPSLPLEHDQFNYDFTTRQLLDKGFFEYPTNNKDYVRGKPNAFITPGYPLFLALIYKIFGYANGSPLTQVKLIQILLGTLTSTSLYLLAKQVANTRVALMASFFSSVYLVFIWSHTLILTETLYTFLFITYLYIQLLAIMRKSGPLNFFAGIALGLAALVRPSIAPLILLPYVYYYIETRNKWLFKYLMLNVSGFVLVMLPWWIRNLVVLKRLILFATQEDPLIRGTYPYDYVKNMPLQNQTREAIKRIIHGFSTQPLLYLRWFTSGKFSFIYLKTFYYVNEAVTTLRWLLPLHYFYVWFGWVGVFLSILKKDIRLIALYIALITLMQLAFVATARYAYPVMPLLMLLTAYIIDTLFFEKQTVPGKAANI